MKKPKESNIISFCLLSCFVGMVKKFQKKFDRLGELQGLPESIPEWPERVSALCVTHSTPVVLLRVVGTRLACRVTKGDPFLFRPNHLAQSGGAKKFLHGYHSVMVRFDGFHLEVGVERDLKCKNGRLEQAKSGNNKTTTGGLCVGEWRVVVIT